VLCREFDIPLSHHDPASDAAAALALVSRAENDLGMDALDALMKPMVPTASAPLRTHEVPAGTTLTGKRVAFTGTLVTMTRLQATERALAAGATTTESVNAKLNYLVLGMEAFAEFSGGTLSRKAREGKALVEAGAQLELLSENDFLRML